MKKLLVVIGSIAALGCLLWILCFGPYHTNTSIDLGTEGSLSIHETVIGDVSDVQFELAHSSGKTFNITNATFRDKNWRDQVRYQRYGDWLVIAMEPEGYVRLITVNTTTGVKHDTTLTPSLLPRDGRYQEKYKDKPDHLHDNGSQVESTSPHEIMLQYTYHAPAEYPTTISVRQRVSYRLDTSTGLLETKTVFDRELNN